MLTDVSGVHHVSAIASDPQRVVDFYTDVLGLRFVRRTVNFEDQFNYHLYFGDTDGSPGSVLTFFAYPREVAGRLGSPGIHTTQLAIPEHAVEYWVERLRSHDVEVGELTTRFGSETHGASSEASGGQPRAETVVPFTDPDGMQVELVTGPSQNLPYETGPVPVDRAVRGVRGVSLQSRSPYVTASLLDTFGFDLVGENDERVRYRLPGGHRSTVDILTGDASFGREGAGSIHHVAFGVEDEATLHEWRELLEERDFDVSRVKDRQFMHSLYVREPGGVLFELATEREGVAVDAPMPGGSLVLPPWLEEDREMIEGQLPPLSAPGERE